MSENIANKTVLADETRIAIYPKIHAVPEHLIKKNFREHAAKFSTYLKEVVSEKKHRSIAEREAEKKAIAEHLAEDIQKAKEE